MEPFGDEIIDKRPREHFCPITLEVMINPVVTSDGFSYEKEAISQHFKVSQISPSTGLPLKNRDIFENRALKAIIEEWESGRQQDTDLIKQFTTTTRKFETELIIKNNNIEILNTPNSSSNEFFKLSLPSQAEQQRMKREEIKKREKVNLLSSEINNSIQHIKNLKNENISYGELLNSLDAMGKFYVEGEMVDCGNKRYNEDHLSICMGCTHKQIREVAQQYIEFTKNRMEFLRLGNHQNVGNHKHRAMDSMDYKIIRESKKVIEEKMASYEELQGISHPLKHEVNSF
jgi:hypothetical protein